MKILIKIFAVFTVVICSINIASGQTTKKEQQADKAAAIKKMIDARDYIFKANLAYPQRGGEKQLTSDYDLRVSRDTVIAFLPYFGRAYMAPNDLNPTEGGIKFTSTNFSYKTKLRKNGNWEISIKPKDKNISNWRDVQELTLNISTSGYASLQVTSTNRDPISFDGYIERKR